MSPTHKPAVDDARIPWRARLVDVADAAGTSKPIASRILNEDPTLKVGDALRSRVLAEADRLGYRPHVAARGLRAARTGALALLVPDLGNPVFAGLFGSAFRRALEREVVVLLAEDAGDSQSEKLFARLVSAGRIDGLMVASTRPEHPLLEMLSERRVPHVFLNRAVPGSQRNITMDDARASRLAVEYLTSLGHQRLAHIAGPLEIDPASRRAIAFAEAARAHSLPPVVVEPEEFLERGGATAARRLFEQHPEITGVYTSSPSQAIGLLHIARACGWEVPNRLSVIAFSDAPVAPYLDPALTTITMPLDLLGETGVDELLAQLAGAPPRDLVIDTQPELVVRGSTAQPRADSVKAPRT